MPVAPQPPPSAAGVNAQLQTAANAPYTGGTGSYNVSSDPAVMAAQGLAAKIRANAQASALAKRKQAAIEYGDPTGVEGVDPATAQAARDNPFSVTKNLEHGYQTGTRDLEEGLNSANLFYSGYRGQQLGEAARGYQNSKYQAATGFKGLMTDINDRLNEALLSADSMEQGALMGSDGGYYGGGDGGGGGGYDPSRVAGGYLGALRGSVVPRLSGARRDPGRPTGTVPYKNVPYGAFHPRTKAQRRRSKWGLPR